jgi:hypothetical protein
MQYLFQIFHQQARRVTELFQGGDKHKMLSSFAVEDFFHDWGAKDGLVQTELKWRGRTEDNKLA